MKRNYLFIGLLILSTFLSMIPFQIPQVKAQTTNSQIFRPFYPNYGKGVVEFALNTNSSIINREINIEGWNITKPNQYDIPVIWMHLKFVFPDIWWNPNDLEYSILIDTFFSLDNGKTFNESRTWETGYLVISDNAWVDGWWEVDYSVPFYEDDFYLFKPTTRIKLQFRRAYYTVMPQVYLANVYWGSGQEPVPPYDYIGASSEYVQYYLFFTVDYQEEQIEYKGEIIPFDYSDTRERLEAAANTIINCMQPSGAVNEVVGKEFGEDSWIVIYSGQLSMMELIDLMKIFPEKNYLLPVKRFIAWMFSKQESNGSFPFILTDGDQHEWENASANEYYGYDHIDSFSALSISLVAKYYNATEDFSIVNKYWNNLNLSMQFLESLNTTESLPLDGYHYNGTHYNIAEWVLLHDACEVYQAVKDYAFLCDVKNLTSSKNYYGNWSNNIAAAIRSTFWNETLGRYVGFYHPSDSTYDYSFVYNIITPLIYGIETNVSRAWKTLRAYTNWGLKSGRYYDKDWAEDYSVFNEYSTMSGMILQALSRLLNDLDFYHYWMKEEFFDVTLFLFSNPIYPKRDLQNRNGFLDYVNLVNYTYAKEYARLVEASAWVIDGLMELNNTIALWNWTDAELQDFSDWYEQETEYWNTTKADFENDTGMLNWNSAQTWNAWVSWCKDAGIWIRFWQYTMKKYLYINDLLQDDDPWFEEPPFEWDDYDWNPRDYWVATTPSVIDIYFDIGLGITGLIMIFVFPLWTIREFKKHGLTDEVFYRVALTIVGIMFGICILILWLW